MGQTLNNIYDNLSFALNLHSEAMARLQEQAATGSRVNRASDDPSAAYRILGLNSQQRSLNNYMDNLSEMIGTLEVTSTVIEDVISVLADVRTQVTQIIGGIYDEESQKRIAEGVNDSLEQAVSLTNTKYMNEYLFGGGKSTSLPYAVERSNGEVTAVTYQGSSSNRNMEVAPGLTASALYIGDSIFYSNSRGDPAFVGDTGAEAGTGTSSVRGDTWLTVTQDGSNYKLSIDDGTSYVTVPVDGDANLAVTNSQTGEVLYVDSTQITNTGLELVRMPGTYDIFSTLISARDILKNVKALSDTQLREVRGNLLYSIEEMENLLAQTEVSVGSKIGFLTDIKNNLEEIGYNTDDEVTRLEEADIAQVAVDISRREVLYEMSLSVAGRILSMSLLDFIS